MTKDEAIATFGFDPDTVGNRPRGWWIVDEIKEEEENGNAQIGYLCVNTRDGGGNPISVEAMRLSNCVGSAENLFDTTYRRYYYQPLVASPPDAADKDK